MITDVNEIIERCNSRHISLASFIKDNKARLQSEKQCAEFVEECATGRLIDDVVMSTYITKSLVYFFVLSGVNIFPYLAINSDNYEDYSMWFDVQKVSFKALNYTATCPRIEVLPHSFFKDTDLKRILLPNVADVGYNGCEKTDITEISLPKCVQINSHAFNDCKNLEIVNIPNIKNIRSDAFAGCENLKKIILPKTKSAIAESREGIETFLDWTVGHGYEKLNVDFEFV